MFGSAVNRKPSSGKGGVKKPAQVAEEGAAPVASNGSSSKVEDAAVPVANNGSTSKVEDEIAALRRIRENPNGPVLNDKAPNANLDKSNQRAEEREINNDVLDERRVGQGEKAKEVETKLISALTSKLSTITENQFQYMTPNQMVLMLIKNFLIILSRMVSQILLIIMPMMRLSFH